MAADGTVKENHVRDVLRKQMIDDYPNVINPVRGLQLNRLAALINEGAARAGSAFSGEGDDGADEECGFVKFDVTDLATDTRGQSRGTPPVLPATSDSQKIPSGAVFLPGIWWMDGNPFPEEVTSSYRISPTTSAVYPCPGSDCRLASPLFATRAWSFNDNWLGRLVMYALGAGSQEIAYVRWYNETYAEAEPPRHASEKLAFIKVSDDHWIRQSTPDGPWWWVNALLYGTDGYKYDLRQVVDENGVATDNFPLLVEHAHSVGSGKLWAYGSDDRCKRRCMILLPCARCNWICGVVR